MKSLFLVPRAICAVAVLLVSRETVVYAQDSAGAASVPPPSTVVKNRAPLDSTTLDVKLPAAKEAILSNRGHVFIVEDHRAPLVTISVSLKSGEFFDAPNKRGVADLVARTLTEGTKSYTAEQIANLSDKYGASFNARSGDERAAVSLTCLSDNIDALLPVLAEIVYEPAFPEDKVKRVQFRARAGATARLTDPNLLAGDALRAAMYGDQSVYGRPSVKAEEIGAVTIADMRQFHQRQYRPDTAIIGVAGDVKSSDIVKKLDSILGKQPNPSGNATELPPASFVQAAASSNSVSPEPIIINRPGSAQTVLNFGFPAIKRSDPDYFPLLLANRVLGGGFSSRLNQKLREEKGYTYGARSTYTPTRWPGIWSATASVRTSVTTDATRDFLTEFYKLQNTPPKPEELALIKQALIGAFALTLESPEAVLARSIERYEFDLPADYWNSYASKVRAIQPDDISHVARKYIGSASDPNKTSNPRVWAVAVGEKSSFEEGVQKAVKQEPGSGTN